MKKIKNLFIVAFVMAFTIVSCGDDATTSTTTVAEDKENIKMATESFYSCLGTLADGDFSSFFYNAVVTQSIVKQDKYGSYEQSWIQFLFNELAEELNSTSDQNSFPYNDLKGKYTWNSSTMKWTKTTSDIVELYFPSTKEEKQNNATLVFDVYEDTGVTLGGDKVKLPAKAHVVMHINSEKTFELSITEATFEVHTNISIPTKFNVSIFTKPFTSTFNITRQTPTQFDIAYSLKSENNCDYIFSNQLYFNNSDYANFTSVEENVKLLKGSFSHNNLAINYSNDIAKGAALNKDLYEMTDAEIATFFDAEMLYNQTKIADVIYDSKEDRFPLYLVFKDGTKEGIDLYFKDAEDRIGKIFEKFFK